MFAVLNKVIEDSGISSFDVVTGPASAVNDNLASFNLTTGKIIKDSTIASTNVVLKTGTTVVGNIAMGTNNITGTGAISSNTYVANNTISIGTTTANAQLQLSNSVVNRKIILYESVINNDHQFYGLGVNTSALRYQVDATTSNHVFNAGVNSTTSNELMRLTGLGNLLVGSSAAATARIVATSGIQNVGGEDSCIRAIGSSAATSAKIELQWLWKIV